MLTILWSRKPIFPEIQFLSSNRVNSQDFSVTSQQLRLSILGKLKSCIFRIHDESGNLDFLGTEFEQLSGYEPDQFSNHNELINAIASDAQKYFDQIAARLTNSDDWDIDFQICHHAGGTRWLNSRGVRSTDAQGVMWLEGVLNDVTERKASDQMATVYGTALMRSNSEVIIFDVDSHQVVFANPAALNNLGYSLPELQSLSVQEFSPGNNHERVRRHFDYLKSRDDYRSDFYDLEMARKSGSRYQLKAFSCLDLGERDLLITIGMDQSEQLLARYVLEETRNRFIRALDGSDTMVWDWDLNNGQYYRSGSVHQWLGKDVSIMEGNAADVVMQHIHPDDRERFSNLMRETIINGSRFRGEFRLMHEDGESVWVQSQGKAIVDENGRTVRLSGTTVNINDKKLAEKKLQETADTLTTVLNSVADGIVTLNGKGQVQAVNPVAGRLLQSSEGKLRGKRLSKLIALDDHEHPDWKKLATGNALPGSIILGNNTIPVEVAIVRSELRQDRLYTVMIHDMTETKRLMDELKRAKVKAEKAAQAKSDFLATMSHEIRTPLNGILGMTQLLLDEDLDNREKELATIIYSSGETLLTIINDVLDLSKIAAGKLDLEHLEFDLRVAIKEVMDLLNSKAVEKDLSFFVDYPIGLPHQLIGDLGRVRQVLMNLLGNAIKFTEHGFIEVVIEDRGCTENEARLRVHVNDTGIGLDQSIQASIFEAFAQADASTTRKYGGTGLGLAISKNLVEHMGGDIGVDTNAEGGCSFWFDLNLTTGAQPIAEKLLVRYVGQRTLVYVRDSKESDLLCRMLRELEMQVLVFKDTGSILREAAESKEPTLVILDEPDSEQSVPALGELRAENQQLTFLQLTSLYAVKRKQKSDSEVHGFLSKPVYRLNLLNVLASIFLDNKQSSDIVITDASPEATQADAIELRILLAEDNVVNQKVAVHMLAKLGCRVDVAADGEEAVRMWSTFPYDIVFMDCQMPKLDGFEATRLIRQAESEKRLPATPIIAMTANAMKGDRQACLAAGMDDYTSKPIRKEELCDVLTRWRPAVGGSEAVTSRTHTS